MSTATDVPIDPYSCTIYAHFKRRIHFLASKKCYIKYPVINNDGEQIKKLAEKRNNEPSKNNINN